VPSSLAKGQSAVDNTNPPDTSRKGGQNNLHLAVKVTFQYTAATKRPPEEEYLKKSNEGKNDLRDGE